MGLKGVYESPEVYRFCMCTCESPEKGVLSFHQFLEVNYH